MYESSGVVIIDVDVVGIPTVAVAFGRVVDFVVVALVVVDCVGVILVEEVVVVVNVLAVVDVILAVVVVIVLEIVDGVFSFSCSTVVVSEGGIFNVPVVVISFVYWYELIFSIMYSIDVVVVDNADSIVVVSNVFVCCGSVVIGCWFISDGFS